jgi:AcrR family transcriptional regulator
VKKQSNLVPRLASLRRAPTQARGGDCVLSILRACERRLANTTFDRLTLEEIAAEANVNVGSIYFFFRDKTSIFCGLIEMRLREIMEQYVIAHGDFDKPFERYLGKLYARLTEVWKRGGPLRGIWFAYRFHPHVLASLHELWRVVDEEMGKKLQLDFPSLTSHRRAVVARVVNASIASTLDSAALLTPAKGRSFRKESLLMISAYARNLAMLQARAKSSRRA